MLLEVSMRMGSKHVNNEVQQVASRRASRQQQRILLQVKILIFPERFHFNLFYFSDLRRGHHFLFVRSFPIPQI